MTLFNSQAADTLLEAAREEEAQNARILDNVGIFTILFSLLIVGLIVITSVVLKNHKIAFGLVTILLMVILLVGLLYAYKTEINTGYYQCQDCEHKFVPEWGEAMFKVRFGVPGYCIRRLECPECGEVTWAEKVLFK